MGRTVALLLAGCTALAACGDTDNAASGKLEVAVGVYPVEEIVRTVGGSDVEVHNVVPPGAEPHDVELAPDDVADVASADLVIYVGNDFQPALEDAAQESDAETIDVLDHVEMSDSDPHYWLDPRMQARVAQHIAEALAKADAQHAADFRQRASNYVALLTELDSEIESMLSNCERRTFVVPHAAFEYLARRYDLRQIAVSGVSAEAEPDPARVAELVEIIESEGITTIFVEANGSTEVMQTIADETGVGVEVLDPLEIRSEARSDNADTYSDVMRSNAAALSDSLGCT